MAVDIKHFSSLGTHPNYPFRVGIFTLRPPENHCLMGKFFFCFAVRQGKHRKLLKRTSVDCGLARLPFMYTPQEILLIALFTQATLYGLYVATLIDCLRWLIFTDDGWKQRDRVNKLMLITTVVIFLLSTVNLAIVLPNQFYIMGASSSATAIAVITVRRYHG